MIDNTITEQVLQSLSYNKLIIIINVTSTLC
jgi:hypothetical protein